MRGDNRGSVVAQSGREKGKPLFEEAGELLRVYDALDVRHRHKLLEAAFVIEEQQQKGAGS